MAGWSYCWCCVAWISLCLALVTASATPHLARSPARPTTSMLCLRASRPRASESSCKTTRSSGCSAATSRPPPPCCGFTPTTSPTYNPPPSTASTAWRRWTWGTTGTCRPWPRTPSRAWAGSTPCTCTTAAWSRCLQGSLQASLISNISTYRYTDNSLILSLLYIASATASALWFNPSISLAQHLMPFLITFILIGHRTQPSY